ncbi:MAG: hypothetical protein Q9225_004561 [Loekoesia sp. 1 TL-2023]
MAANPPLDPRYFAIGNYEANWAGPYRATTAATQQDLLIIQALSAARNYYWMTVDMASSTVDASSEARIDFGIWMLYYYQAFTALVKNGANAASEKKKRKTSIHESLLRLLNGQLVTFRSMLGLLGVDVTRELTKEAMPSSDKEARLMVPRAQPLELFVSYLWNNAGNEVTNLGTLQAVLRQTQTVDRQHRVIQLQPAAEDELKTGLPNVLFVCYEDRIAACSIDHWSLVLRKSQHRNALRAGRDARFALQQPNEVDEIDTLKEWQAKIWDRWNFVTDRFVLSNANFRKDAEALKLTQAQYNDFVRAMYHADADAQLNLPSSNGGTPLDPTQGFNHLGETGRAFSGAGGDMLAEMSRCWKCRFLHHYRIARPNHAVDDGLERVEEPNQTEWACNQERDCAEDLAHHRCRTLRNSVPSGQDPQQQRFDFLPY